MYADDIMLYVRRLSDNLAPLLQELIKFGGLMGIMINWMKSVVFPLTPATSTFDMDYPLRWADGVIKYLGVWISRDIPEICREIYGKR